MKNISKEFEQEYRPYKAILFYGCTASGSEVYVESYDIGKQGNPINAHPLSIKEMSELAGQLKQVGELSEGHLFPKGIMPENVLYTTEKQNGTVIWYTPAQQVNMLFAPQLDIPNGLAKVPAMVWKANRQELSVFALKSSRKPKADTPLCYAPYFNIYEDGKVCMGTVAVDLPATICMEEFIHAWQQYFWNSYFSHLILNYSPVKGNIVQLWQQQVTRSQDFPASELKPTTLTLKKILL
jgi:PRTRC genetic system protein B